METSHAHLDLKLDNVLIGSDFKIRLCDMGTATALDEKVLSKYGTEDYMAPEVFQVSKTKEGYNGLKADMFSLGMCIFIMNFGLPAW